MRDGVDQAERSSSLAARSPLPPPRRRGGRVELPGPPGLRLPPGAASPRARVGPTRQLVRTTASRWAPCRRRTRSRRGVGPASGARPAPTPPLMRGPRRRVLATVAPEDGVRRDGPDRRPGRRVGEHALLRDRRTDADPGARQAGVGAETLKDRSERWREPMGRRRSRLIAKRARASRSRKAARRSRSRCRPRAVR